MADKIDMKTSKTRRYKRVQITATTGALCEGRHRFHTALEISEGGFLLQSLHRYSIGDILDVGILLPGEQTIVAEAEIMYALEPDGDLHFFGARFLDTSPEICESIRRYVVKNVRT